jgi:hypothetical protein
VVSRLVSVRQASDHLRLHTEECDRNEDVLGLTLAAAQALVLDYVKQRRSDGEAWSAEVDAWTPATVPPQVKAAILYQCAELFRFRGDDVEMPDRRPGELAPMVVALLYRFRDPAIA